MCSLFFDQLLWNHRKKMREQVIREGFFLFILQSLSVDYIQVFVMFLPVKFYILSLLFFNVLR